MDIDLNSLEQNTTYSQIFLFEEDSELKELNCRGEIAFEFSVIFAGEQKLIEGLLQGLIKSACRYCSEDLQLKYSLPIKILLEFKDKKGVFWDDEADEIDNYCISVGFNEPKLSIISIIREQILLNLNPDMSSEYTQGSVCSSCKDQKSNNFLEHNTQSLRSELERIKLKLQREQ